MTREELAKSVAVNGGVVRVSRGIHSSPLEWVTWDIVLFPDGFYFLADEICNVYTDQRTIRGKVEMQGDYLYVDDRESNFKVSVGTLINGLDGDEELILQARARHEWQLKNRTSEEWRYRVRQLEDARAEAIKAS